ncbi:hypothetical protein GE09DRAFT_517846 [Coniochaeta sp. 2T2.1]|nr:hypothetical protein GE09DRAFT_517846 [Coniochaeta sp. 2T2.1]
MYLFKSLIILAAAVAAMPTESQGDFASLAKRKSCAQEFPQGCANVCCKLAGGCSFLNCAASKVSISISRRQVCSVILVAMALTQGRSVSTSGSTSRLVNATVATANCVRFVRTGKNSVGTSLVTSEI